MGFSTDTLKVLIVEDNPGDVVLVEDFLHEEIAVPDISYAKDLAEAREVVRQHYPFDAILLDLTLPDASGEELVQQMVDLAGNQPIIVLTGYSDKEFGIKTLSLGVHDYLLKDELTGNQLYKSIAYSIERAKIVLRLKDSEQNYRKLFSLSPLPMWVYDLENWQIQNANDAALHMFGYSREEFLSMSIRELRPAEDVPLLEEALKSAHRLDRHNQGIFRHLLKNGTVTYSEVHSNSITINGKLSRLVLAFDVTERMRHLKAIEDQNQQLREIAWFQSHVVRAPLARIMGIVDLMSDMGDAEMRETSRMMGHLIESAVELDGIIHDIVNKTERIGQI